MVLVSVVLLLRLFFEISCFTFEVVFDANMIRQFWYLLLHLWYMRKGWQPEKKSWSGRERGMLFKRSEKIGKQRKRRKKGDGQNGIQNVQKEWNRIMRMQKERKEVMEKGVKEGMCVTYALSVRCIFLPFLLIYYLKIIYD